MFSTQSRVIFFLGLSFFVCDHGIISLIRITSLQPKQLLYLELVYRSHNKFVFAVYPYDRSDLWGKKRRTDDKVRHLFVIYVRNMYKLKNSNVS